MQPQVKYSPVTSVVRVLDAVFLIGAGIMTVAGVLILIPRVPPRGHAAHSKRKPKLHPNHKEPVMQHLAFGWHLGIWAGWPRVIAHPGLPQIRTCRTTASGSSSNSFASLAAD